MTGWGSAILKAFPRIGCRHLAPLGDRRVLAHSGCTAPEIMSISGHSTLAQVQVYIDEVEQECMAEAAMNKRQIAAADKKATSSGKP
jgi:hypothetical protein